MQNNMNHHIETLSLQIKALEEKLKFLPTGKLLIVHNQKYVKWFLSNGRKPVYIPKSNQEFASQLALRKYFTEQLDFCRQKYSCLKDFLTLEQDNQAMLSNYLDSTSPYYNLLSPTLLSMNSDIVDWMNESYQTNTSHPEHLIHKTLSGQCVRSKSEAIIFNCLLTSNIPFRYECALILGDVTLFPDFTIMHPKTKELFYYEHFGMMDNASYRDHTYEKLKIYGNHGIIPSVNLITTSETSKSPLDSTQIQGIIDSYFR